MICAGVSRWAFEPAAIDGGASEKRALMQLILLAIPAGNGYAMKVEKVQFFGSRRKLPESPSPKYPRDAARVGLNGAVAIAVRVDAEGHVTDTVVLQSTLGFRRTPPEMKQWQASFERAVLDSAKEWRYQPADVALGETADTTLVVSTHFWLETKDGRDPFKHWQVQSGKASSMIPWLAAELQQYDISGWEHGEGIALADPPVRLKNEVTGKDL